MGKSFSLEEKSLEGFVEKEEQSLGEKLGYIVKSLISDEKNVEKEFIGIEGQLEALEKSITGKR